MGTRTWEMTISGAGGDRVIRMRFEGETPEDAHPNKNIERLDGHFDSAPLAFVGLLAEPESKPDTWTDFTEGFQVVDCVDTCREIVERPKPKAVK